MDTVIELKNVTYTYPLAERPAIRDMSFRLERGGLYGVIGKNGSGKTTLCALIRGFAPDFYRGTLEGSVLVQGRPTVDYESGELSLRIGYVFQNPFNQISGAKDTVFEEVAFGLENFGVPVEEIEQRVVEIMEITNISALADKNPFELSGGQQQRLALASIIVLKPDILVIDEPTSQLDPEGTENVFEIIKMMKKEKKTIFLVEHKVDLLAEYADTILVLNDGRLEHMGPACDVLADERITNCGVRLPSIARLGNALIRRGLPLGKTPVTEEEAIVALRRVMEAS
jgi:energy-coupling factor transport system ATP-binding protein